MRGIKKSREECSEERRRRNPKEPAAEGEGICLGSLPRHEERGCPVSKNSMPYILS